MAHQLENMAYVGATPWHGLGNKLTTHQPLEVWQHEAGMNWQIEESPVRFLSDSAAHLGSIHTFPEQKVLYRSDTRVPLSVVSQRYKVVPPFDVLEFYRDLTEYAGYELETAGVLKGGRKFWALARTGQTSVLKGNDQVNGYLLLATSCDGSLATVATPTTVRVVCNNTLAIAVNGSAESIRVPHNTEFNPQAVKRQLGVSVSQWDDFMYRMKMLSERKVNTGEALGYFLQVICDTETDVANRRELTQHRALQKVQDLYSGKGRGSQLESAQHTVWGLLNAVTEYVDHDKRARSVDHRLDSAWFGQGAGLKQKALDHALALVA
jgi:phage/plasmid-like protein (TIGR03299 family)